MALSSEQGFAHWLAQGTIVRGWALAEQGQEEEGIAQMRQGLAAHQATGAELGRPCFLALLAEAYGKVGQVEEGLTAAGRGAGSGGQNWGALVRGGAVSAQGRADAATGKSKGQKAKGKRQKAQIPTPASPDPHAEAEACFLKAIDIARKQQAKSLELRAVMSLVRLRQQQATQDASRTRNTKHAPDSTKHTTMLSEVYNWFTEGFDTKDLQEAKALLEELA